jgi:hypothetical protein
MAYSQSALGRQIFGHFWGISVLTAVGNTKPIHLPFDADYKSYMALHQKVIKDLVNKISELTGLSEEVMAIALDEAPWVKIKGDYYGSLGLNGEFAMSSGKREWVEYDYTDLEEIHRVSSVFIKRELINFFEALLEARFCFYAGEEGNLPAQCQTIFQYFLELIGELRPYPDVENLLVKIYSDWTQKKALLILAQGEEVDSDYQAWLSARMLEFEASKRRMGKSSQA